MSNRRVQWSTITILLMASAVAQAEHKNNQNVVIVLDGSGSMSGEKMDMAKRALIQVVDQIPSGSNVGLIVFSNNINGWAYDLGPLDREKFSEAVNSIEAGGGTPLGKYMIEGANALIAFRKKSPYGFHKLLIVTDGESNDDISKPLIGEYGILSKGLFVESIGVKMRSKHTLATFVPYRDASDEESLKKAINSVFAESTSSDDNVDFDILSGLDYEVAQTVIQSLSKPDNAPVGSIEMIDEKGNVFIEKVVKDDDNIFSTVFIFFIIAIEALVSVFVIFYFRNRKT